MIGLRNVGDETFVEVMQAINGLVPHSCFAIPFLESVGPLASWLAFALSLLLLRSSRQWVG